MYIQYSIFGLWSYAWFDEEMNVFYQNSPSSICKWRSSLSDGSISSHSDELKNKIKKIFNTISVVFVLYPRTDEVFIALVCVTVAHYRENANSLSLH